MSERLLEILYDYHKTSFDDWSLTAETVKKIDVLYQSQLVEANTEIAKLEKELCKTYNSVAEMLNEYRINHPTEING